MAVGDLQQRTRRFGVGAREEVVARQLRADHARQPERPLEFGGGGGHVRQRQRGECGEAAGMLLADRRKPVVDAPAQRQRTPPPAAIRSSRTYRAATARSSRPPGGPSGRDGTRRHRTPWRAALRPSGLQHLDAVAGCAGCAVPWLRARRASATSAGFQWACMSIMAVWLPSRAVRQLNPMAGDRNLASADLALVLARGRPGCRRHGCRDLIGRVKARYSRAYPGWVRLGTFLAHMIESSVVLMHAISGHRRRPRRLPSASPAAGGEIDATGDAVGVMAIGRFALLYEEFRTENLIRSN